MLGRNYFWIVFVVISGLLTSCRDVTTAPVAEKDPGSWAFSNFVKVDSINPIMQPDTSVGFAAPLRGATVNWEARNVLNPTAVVKDGKVYMLYRAQDQQMTSRLGLAMSSDGLHFEKQAAPVFYPAEDSLKRYEWPGGVEDPRIVESEDGRYIMTYTAYDGKTARLCLASSRDLTTWTKHGLVMGYGKYRDTWSKSGAIIAKRDGSRMIATKIDGKYWMYFGDTDLFMATSEDLIHWEVAENAENGQLISVLHPRMGYFDSRLVEPGPYALLRDEGVVLIYNGSNAANFNDAALPKFTYAAGQALFDARYPYKLIDRTEGYFIHPDKPYEKVGEVNEVCFVEGLVYFQDKWFLYYGTADSRIAVAVQE
ncbi:glycoside hydrolase family 130 protein [Flavilitoribacter nigricans]|uniref:Glycosidase n=1 Tax=Flavilitoribacter nigricans (strain ATCC 23147 / DSM 23189 / NBRC 102662 / NCIMB 1420 / SS-2) TaxID=1122177 RepID=A0A2D0MZA1_FLAN2|nr:glycoside hydrolase family 130 protein [Flavilitoribacter nigricans]PHN01458.1 glycosidase [Flavilitoribacter nigricans DSM 23189 = NBRC 102662]